MIESRLSNTQTLGGTDVILNIRHLTLIAQISFHNAYEQVEHLCMAVRSAIVDVG